MKFISKVLTVLFNLFIAYCIGMIAGAFGLAKLQQMANNFGLRSEAETLRNTRERRRREAIRMARASTYGESMGIGSMDDLGERHNITARQVARREKELLNKIQDLHFEDPVAPINQVFQNTRKLLLTRYNVD